MANFVFANKLPIDCEIFFYEIDEDHINPSKMNTSDPLWHLIHQIGYIYKNLTNSLILRR